MSSIRAVVDVILSDISTKLIFLTIGFLIYKLFRFYIRLYSLPPGPIPLPIIGNLLAFKLTKLHWSLELAKMAKKYGPVMTVWFGNTPRVLISDIDLAKEAFNKNDFAGRPNIMFTEIFIKEGQADLIWSDYGYTWEALRRVTHSAAQKYSTTAKLTDLVMDCVDHTVNTIIDKEGLNKPFVAFDYIFNMFLNIMATSAFGKRYELDDPEYNKIKYVLKDSIKEHSLSIILWESFPMFRKYDKNWTQFKRGFDDLVAIVRRKYQDHLKDYDERVVRDFCDTLINAKHEALREAKEAAPYLTDNNLAMVAFDLVFAGTDTSQTTFRWLLLYLLFDKRFEQKLRREIESKIGDRIPTHEDRNRCHYVMAFISEALRHSSIASAGAPHKAVVTSKLGNYTFPEGTQVFTFQGHILHQSEHWENPQEFNPQRFLENDKYLTHKPKAFIPFGVGRRVCLGEKLAIADLFLVLVRFLQKTSNYDLVLHMDSKADLYPDPNNIFHFETHPKHYEISLKRK